MIAWRPFANIMIAWRPFANINNQKKLYTMTRKITEKKTIHAYLFWVHIPDKWMESCHQKSCWKLQITWFGKLRWGWHAFWIVKFGFLREKISQMFLNTSFSTNLYLYHMALFSSGSHIQFLNSASPRKAGPLEWLLVQNAENPPLQIVPLTLHWHAPTILWWIYEILLKSHKYPVKLWDARTY